MFLPIGDLPNPPGKAYVNNLLIGCNVAVYVLLTLPMTTMRADAYDPVLIDYLRQLGVHSARQAQQLLSQISAYDLFVFKHGFKPAAASASSLFSSLFLHGGLFHLAGNMLFLWIFGDNVEHRLGGVRYLLLYLFSGVMATLFFAFFLQDSYTPLIGASGAISGVIGCYFIWFPRNKVKTFVFLFPFIMDSFYLPARLVLGIYLVVDNLLPFLIMRNDGGVAHGAHLGGFIAGAGVAYALDLLPGMRRGKQLHQQKSPCDDPDASIVARLQCLIEQQRLRDAAGLYFGLQGRQQRLEALSTQVLMIGDFLLKANENDAALALFRRFIGDRPTDPDLDQAFLGAGRALLAKENCQTRAHQYFLAALDVTKSAGLTAEAKLYLRSIEAQAKPKS